MSLIRERDERGHVVVPRLVSLSALRAAAMRDRGGFVTREEVAQIAADPHARLTPLLVRCGGCRFIAAAQDVQHLLGIIAREASDYVRDVSFPASEGGR